MPTWGEILKELQAEQLRAATQPQPAAASPFDLVRRRYLTKLHQHTGNNVIAYTTNWTTKEGGGPTASINAEDVQALMEVVHGLRGPKLDLVLHSPGGSAEATEAVVDYLRSKFDHIRVFIPQAAMSAATMLACAADEIVMGRHSSIGPIDPQIVVLIDGQLAQVPAAAITAQFKQAQQECMDDPRKLPSWIPMLRQYGPALLAQCRYHEDLAKTLVGTWIARYMLRGDADAIATGERIAAHLTDHQHFKTHGRFIGRDEASKLGLKVRHLETDQTLQDLVLSVFHASTLTFTSTPAVKIVENHLGRAFIKSREFVINLHGAPPAPPGGSQYRAAPTVVRQLELSAAAEAGADEPWACQEPIATQLAGLAALDAAWLDGGGPTYSPERLNHLRRILEPLIDGLGLPRPFIYPTPDGEIRAEWPSPRWDVVLTIDQGATRAELVANATSGDESVEASFPADVPGMLTLGARLAHLLLEAE